MKMGRRKIPLFFTVGLPKRFEYFEFKRAGKTIRILLSCCFSVAAMKRRSRTAIYGFFDIVLPEDMNQPRFWRNGISCIMALLPMAKQKMSEKRKTVDAAREYRIITVLAVMAHRHNKIQLAGDSKKNQKSKKRKQKART